MIPTVIQADLVLERGSVVGQLNGRDVEEKAGRPVTRFDPAKCADISLVTRTQLVTYFFHNRKSVAVVN